MVETKITQLTDNKIRNPILFINFIFNRFLCTKVEKIACNALFIIFVIRPESASQIPDTMHIKRIFYIGLSLIFFGLGFTNTSCKSRKALCDANSQYNVKKHKKNKSSYSTRYGYKSKPVRKSYVIRNGR